MKTKLAWEKDSFGEWNCLLEIESGIEGTDDIGNLWLATVEKEEGE